MTNRHQLPHLLLILTIINCTNLAVCSENGARKIVETADLALEGKMSALSKRPILLMISRSGCSFCAKIRSEVLEPMLISGDYEDKIIIRELTLNKATAVRDFGGKISKASEISDRYSVRVTPTLLFLGPGGEELAERIVGINTVELFSYYVDQAIDEAILKLHFR